MEYNGDKYQKAREKCHMDDRQFKTIMDSIVAALIERGYDPYSQLYGYLQEDNPIYITQHNSARWLIQSLDKEQIKRYGMEMK